jgi:hypothetical protein
MSFSIGPEQTRFKAPAANSATNWHYVLHEVEGITNYPQSGTMNHWFRINLYGRYVNDGQGGKVVLLFTNNPQHAQRACFKEIEIVTGSGVGGGYSTTSDSSAMTARYLKDVYLGWNYYAITYTVYLYYPNSGLSISGMGDSSWPLLMKIEESGNGNYSRQKTLHTYAQVAGSFIHNIGRDRLTEYLGASTPSYYSGNYTQITIT